RGIQVVATPGRPVVVGPGIAGREIDETQFRIDGRRLPDRAAAVLPRVVVLRPAFVARLTWTRNRVEGPDEATIPRVVRLDATTRAAIGAGEAGDHHAVEVHGGGGDREVVLPALGLDRPRDPAADAV